MKKNVFFTFLLMAFIQAIYGQLPSATIEASGETAFCEAGNAKVKISFQGSSPFGYVIKLYKTDDPNSYVLISRKADNPIHNTEIPDGFLILEYSITENRSFELVEIFDNTLPSNLWNIGSGYKNVSGSAAFTIDQRTAPNAGPDQSGVCGYKAQLAASPQLSTSQIQWDTPVTGSLSATNIVNPVFNAPTDGTYTLTFKEIRGACTDQDQVDINLLGSPKAILSGDTSICRSGELLANISLEGYSPWEFTIKNSDGSQNLTKTNVTTPAYAFNIPTVGAQTYTLLTVKDKNNCLAENTDMTGQATVANLEPIVSAGPDQTVCGQTNTTLEGSNDKGTSLWTSSPSTIIDNLGSVSTNTSANGYGYVEYTLTADNAGCTASDKITVHFAEQPDLALTTPETTICEGTTAILDVLLSQNGPYVINFTENGIAQSIVISNNMDQIELSPIETTSYLFSRVMDKNGCSKNLSNLWTLTVEPKQTPNAGLDQTLGRQYSTMLTAAPQNVTGKWEYLSNKDTSAIKSPDSYQTEVVNLVVGTNVFKWTMIPEVCPQSSDEITVTVKNYTTYNGFSPDGDNINEFFIIEGANSDEANELSVFTPKGKLVYQARNYQNNWNGTDLNGSKLESGTYFYIFTSANNAPVKDYVIIRR